MVSRVRGRATSRSIPGHRRARWGGHGSWFVRLEALSEPGLVRGTFWFVDELRDSLAQARVVLVTPECRQCGDRVLLRSGCDRFHQVAVPPGRRRMAMARCDRL